MITIGHHTCYKTGGKDYVLSEAPFSSVFDEENHKLPFLGTGYYLWDNNIEMALDWGNMKYNNDYFIVEFGLNLENEVFLDLVGSREDIIYFSKLINKLKDKGYDRAEKWTIGAFIEYLKRISRVIPGIFPFKIIRAVDNSITPAKQFKFNFVVGKQGYINLNPRYVICFIEKNDLYLTSRKIVHES